MQSRFISELELVVKKERTLEVVRDEGWYSEADMKQELKWSSTTPQPMHCASA